jgi:hypothetical protein
MSTVLQSLALIGAIGIATSVHAQTDTSALVRARSGCYALTLGRWSGPLPTSSPEAHTPPVRFRLDTIALMTRPGRRFAVDPAQVIPGRMAASWALLPNDSIGMFWSTGFIGVRLRLAVRGDSLVGFATAFRDAHSPLDPPDPTASVTATRAVCPSGHS